MILAVVFVGIAGAEIQLGPAVGAVEQAGENAGSSCFCRPAFVLPKFLYPFPLSLINDGGLAHYLTVWLSDQRDKVEDLEFVVSEKDQEINRLRNEIMLNSGIKQSVRQVARGVKRRIRGE